MRLLRDYLVRQVRWRTYCPPVVQAMTAKYRVSGGENRGLVIEGGHAKAILTLSL
jgi:hypothetical protein